MTTRQISWRFVARRAGRNDLPAILFHYWDQLPAQDKPGALSSTWTMAEYPLAHATASVWVALFDEVGYMVNGRVMDRDNDPELPEVVTLWRGAIPALRDGMSWTLNRDQGLWFANRWRGMDGTEEAHLYRIEIPSEYVLARLPSRGEDEVVVDTSNFDDHEYILEEF